MATFQLFSQLGRAKDLSAPLCVKTNGFVQEAKSYELSVILPTRGAAVEGVLVWNTRRFKTGESCVCLFVCLYTVF